MVRLVNELPRVDNVNEALIGGLFARGGLGHAKLGDDGVTRATVRIPAGEYLWRPAIIVMPRGGELELDIYNEDPYAYHAAVLPNSGERHAMVLPINTRGKARVRLDQPGSYWFGCPVANHATRALPNWPVTERSQPFAAMDSSRRGSAPPVAQAVTPERLLRARAEPQNWLTYYGAYDGQRFSALDQITRANVASLRPAWVSQASPLGLTPTPAAYSFEAAPIVVDGVTYVSGFEGYVWALDAVTGRRLWQSAFADARTGEVLWRFNTGNGIHSNPVTYSVRGKQYVAVPNGWGGWIDGFGPALFGARRGTALHVFALP